MNSYQKAKERAREKAIMWQYRYCERPHTYSEDAEDAAYFRKLAKRYGLTEEFIENGII